MGFLRPTAVRDLGPWTRFWNRVCGRPPPPSTVPLSPTQLSAPTADPSGLLAVPGAGAGRGSAPQQGEIGPSLRAGEQGWHPKHELQAPTPDRTEQAWGGPELGRRPAGPGRVCRSSVETVCLFIHWCPHPRTYPSTVHPPPTIHSPAHQPSICPPICSPTHGLIRP